MGFSLSAPPADSIIRRAFTVQLDVTIDARADEDDLALAGTYVAVIDAPPAYGEHLVCDAALNVFHETYGIESVDDVDIEAKIIDHAPDDGQAIGLGRHDIEWGDAIPDQSNFLAPATCVISQEGRPNRMIRVDAEPWLRHIGKPAATSLLDKGPGSEASRQAMVAWLVENGHDALLSAASAGAQVSAIDLPTDVIAHWVDKNAPDAAAAPQP